MKDLIKRQYTTLIKCILLVSLGIIFSCNNLNENTFEINGTVIGLNHGKIALITYNYDGKETILEDIKFNQGKFI